MAKETNLRHSYSLHSSIRKVPSAKIRSFPVSLSKCSSLNGNITNGQKIYPSNRELPCIKEKCKPSLLEIKLRSIDGDLNHLQYRTEPKPRVNFENKESKHPSQRMDQLQRQVRLGTVVYNYCTNSNVDECLLNYNRKSEQLSRLSKQG